MAQHDDTWRFLRSLGHAASIGSRVVGRSRNAKLPASSINAAEGIDQVELALLLIDPGDHQHIALWLQAEGLQSSR